MNTSPYIRQPRPISEAQREASRRNGRLSRGPVTEQGKRNSARNAIRHGMCADNIVLEGEDRGAYLSLLASLTRLHKPQDETESDLVETLANAAWLQRRLLQVHRAATQMEIHKVCNTRSLVADTQSGRTAIAFANTVTPERQFELFHRYYDQWERTKIRALNTLHKHRKISQRTRQIEGNNRPVWDPQEREKAYQPPPDSPGSRVHPHSQLADAPNRPPEARESLGLPPQRSRTPKRHPRGPFRFDRRGRLVALHVRYGPRSPRFALRNPQSTPTCQP